MKVEGKRLNRTSFNISTSLLYVGGDYITHFLVSFTERNGTEWVNEIIVEAHTGSMEQGLDWYGIVTSYQLTKLSKLQVVIVNNAGYKSAPHIIEEPVGIGEWPIENFNFNSPPSLSPSLSHNFPPSLPLSLLPPFLHSTYNDICTTFTNITYTCCSVGSIFHVHVLCD